YEDMLLAVGRIGEALNEARRSIELDPLSVHILSEAQFAHLVAGQNDKTIALGRKIAEIDPQVGLGHVYSGLAYGEMRDFPRALRELETAVSLEPTPLAKGFLAHVRALAGDRAGSLRILDELKALRAKRYVCA